MGEGGARRTNILAGLSHQILRTLFKPFKAAAYMFPRVGSRNSTLILLLPNPHTLSSENKINVEHPRKCFLISWSMQKGWGLLPGDHLLKQLCELSVWLMIDRKETHNGQHAWSPSHSVVLLHAWLITFSLPSRSQHKHSCRTSCYKNAFSVQAPLKSDWRETATIILTPCGSRSLNSN